MNKPIAKIEGQSQCSGEAEFISDIAPAKGELCAAFVISDAANCDIDVIDPSEALVKSAFGCLKVTQLEISQERRRKSPAQCINML